MSITGPPRCIFFQKAPISGTPFTTLQECIQLCLSAGSSTSDALYAGGGQIGINVPGLICYCGSDASIARGTDQRGCSSCPLDPGYMCGPDRPEPPVIGAIDISLNVGGMVAFYPIRRDEPPVTVGPSSSVPTNPPVATSTNPPISTVSSLPTITAGSSSSAQGSLSATVTAVVQTVTSFTTFTNGVIVPVIAFTTLPGGLQPSNAPPAVVTVTVAGSPPFNPSTGPNGTPSSADNQQQSNGSMNFTALAVGIFAAVVVCVGILGAVFARRNVRRKRDGMKGNTAGGFRIVGRDGPYGGGGGSSQDAIITASTLVTVPPVTDGKDMAVIFPDAPSKDITTVFPTPSTDATKKYRHLDIPVSLPLKAPSRVSSSPPVKNPMYESEKLPEIASSSSVIFRASAGDVSREISAFGGSTGQATSIVVGDEEAPPLYSFNSPSISGRGVSIPPVRSI
ncbi:hypothetical protein HDU67_001143 [Dinochytrium kinnereticum]|nr:hypothetical protein HDU67_001143 [Dinochytrium kinnereticum]